MKSKLRILTQMNIFRFIYYNFFCKKIQRTGKGFFIPLRHAVIELGKDAKVILHDGNFFVNYYRPSHSKAEAYLRMSDHSTLEIFETSMLYYHSTIEIKKNAVVTIGQAAINSGAVILAAQQITIGKEVLISREVFIYDADHHPILNEIGEQINPPKPVIIEDHVWIGLKAMILRGSKIGSGAMIAAGAMVGGKIKAGTMASGNPARSYSEIRWKV